MTKKDYELIASVLKFCKPSKIAIPKGYELRSQMHEDITRELCDTLASKNPRFQKDKFLKACGVELSHDEDCQCKDCQTCFHCGKRLGVGTNDCSHCI